MLSTKSHWCNLSKLEYKEKMTSKVLIFGSFFVAFISSSTCFIFSIKLLYTAIQIILNIIFS